MSTVLLFDIDGTILLSGGAGRRAMVGAFAERHGRPDAFEGMGFGGMTDPAIIRQGLRNVGADDGPGAVDEMLQLYLARLERELPLSETRLLAGVGELLERLRAEEGERVVVGLGTGNVQAGARLKLGRVGLGERFAFGGFGCDAEERAELIRVGARRGAERLGMPVDRCRVVVIGDTPLDVRAARGAKAECLAVASGMSKHEELLAERPDHCCADLTDESVWGFLLD